jgi:hypothetical protein
VGKVSANQHWYIKRGDQVKGPFAAIQIRKYGALGRIRELDELSIDQQDWRPAKTYNELFPGGKMDALALDPRDDERIHKNRGTAATEVTTESPSNIERRAGRDRRAPEAPEVIKRREQRERVLQSLWTDKQSERFPIFAVLGLVVVIAVLGWYLTPTKVRVLPNCDQPAQPGVNWDNCRKEQAQLAEADLTGAKLRNTRFIAVNLQAAILDNSDLAYANLLQANLGYASLKQASLKGSNLKFADLSSANLTQSDLSYADLSSAQIAGAVFSDAILSNTIWIDGRTCAEGSVGTCLR